MDKLTRFLEQLKSWKEPTRTKSGSRRWKAAARAAKRAKVGVKPARKAKKRAGFLNNLFPGSQGRNSTPLAAPLTSAKA